MPESAFECHYTPGEELVIRLRSPLLNLFPTEVRSHILEARKETLLAIRSLLDAVIERVEEKEKGPRRRRRTQIKVE